jgi:undecaprenyl diphosphate synthase
MPDHGGRARYVAIITDGNGRWAQRRGLPVVEGHRAGADTVKARLRDAVDLGVRELTVYSFSTENWSRSAEEVTGLMRMFGERLDVETPELKDEGVRIRSSARGPTSGSRPCCGTRWSGPRPRRRPASA